MPRRARSKLPWETPELRSLPSSLLDRPPGAERRPEPLPRIGRHSVAALVAHFGSPLVVIDEDALRAAYRGLVGAFRRLWRDTVIGYSVKTNYLSSIVAALRSEGAFGEVVSGFEYRLCRDLGIPGAQILFNGPWKTDEDLRTAFVEGSHVNLDGDDEIGRAAAIAETLDRPASVGIRVNMKLNDPPWDKFGFGLETGHALDAARRIARSKGLRLRGLHMHVGTYVPDPAVYGRAAEALIGLALRLERELDFTIEHLDLGGGYATRNTLRGALLAGEATAAAPEDYAAAITTPLRMAARQFRRRPRLYLEPGRILVDGAVSEVTTVRAVKRVSGGRKAALIDAGVHILPTAFWYNHEVRPVTDRGQAVESYRLVGPLCMQIDVVRDAVELPALRAGDLLVIRDTGAYNFSQSMQFIYMRPAIVQIRGPAVHLVREAESDAFVRQPERLPPHLLNDETQGSILARGAPASSGDRPAGSRRKAARR